MKRALKAFVALSFMFSIVALADEREDAELDPKLPPASQRADDDRFLLDLVKNTAEGTARSFVIGEATRFVDAQIAKQLKDGVSQYAADAVTAYSIYRNASAYGDAASEQSRYFAAANMVADVLTLSYVGSAIGGVMKGVLMGQAVIAAYITKDGYKKMLREIDLAERIETERLTIVYRRAKAEHVYLKTLWHEAVAAIEVANRLQDEFGKNCGVLEKVASQEALKICIKRARDMLVLRSLAVRQIQSMFGAHLEVLSIDRLENLMKLPHGKMSAEMEQIEDSLKNARERLREIEATVTSLEFQRHQLDHRRALQPHQQVKACLDEIERHSLPTLTSIARFDRQDPADRAIRAIQLEEAQADFEKFCRRVDTPFPRVRRLLDETDRRLKSAAAGEE